MTALPVVPIAPNPRFPAHCQHAYRVLDDSMDKLGIVESGPLSTKCWVVGVDYESYVKHMGSPPSGEYVLVEIKVHKPERILREIRWHEDRIELLPRSTNTAYQPIFLPRPENDGSPIEHMQILDFEWHSVQQLYSGSAVSTRGRHYYFGVSRSGRLWWCDREERDYRRVLCNGPPALAQSIQARLRTAAVRR